MTRIDAGQSVPTVVNIRTGETAIRLVPFAGPRWVRLVFPDGLDGRSGRTREHEEAVELRDALTEALAEIERGRAVA